jgi:hypothetical protein
MVIPPLDENKKDKIVISCQIAYNELKAKNQAKARVFNPRF